MKRSMRILVTTVLVVGALALSMGEALAADGPPACTRMTKAAFRACLYGAYDAYYLALGTNPDFALAEYSFNNDPATGGVANWSEDDKVAFIETTYNLLQSTYPMIGHIHWWFIGRGPTNARIHFE